MDAVLVFPNQLFEDHPYFEKDRVIFLVEEDTFFTRYRFHKQKIVLHRASMKAFRDEKKKWDIHYIENKPDETLETLYGELVKSRVKKIVLTEVLDHQLCEKLSWLSEKNSIKIERKKNPGFMTDETWINEYFTKNSFRMTSFYIAQRKRLNILIDDDQKPAGGKWSFDPENRKKLPKDMKAPEIWRPKINDYIEEAYSYVEERYLSNPGNVENFIHPVTRRDAETGLEDFIENRLRYFGDYQDAISVDQPYLFHSLISPSLNIGLLNPSRIVDKVIKAYEKNKYPLNAVEGFLRQLIGWREYMRAIYILKGKKMGEANFWGTTGKLSDSFYTAKTGVTPIDNTVNKVRETGYAHHIERLMILGNFMLLKEISPSEVFRWFMEMFIDSYEWVMKPNVYGMSQYSEGAFMTTKPYISSSNYIRKMSDYKKGDWCDIWDALFWMFIEKHRDKIANIPRMRVMLYNLDKIPEERLEGFRKIKRGFG